MTGFPANHLQLTRSFRFGPRIAAVANRWLVQTESDMRLTGSGPATSRVGPSRSADAILCRGNADAMWEVLGFLHAGIPVAFTGGGAALRKIAEAVQRLKSGHGMSHQELFAGRLDAYLAGSWPGSWLARRRGPQPLVFRRRFYEDVMRTGEIRRHSMLSQATPATVLDDLSHAVPATSSTISASR